MISFGPRSILLLVGTAHGIVLAALLLRAPSNRIANRLLALLLAAVALRVFPYIIGFAGFYDAYPWLSYFPYEFSLGYGALIWLYAHVVCQSALPPRWRWHLAPAVGQGVYYAVMFAQPLAFKNQCNSTVHVPHVVPVETIWSMLAMAAYLSLAWREYTSDQRWPDSDLSNREDFRLTWLRGFLLAFGVTLLFWIATALIDAFVRDLNYFDRFPLYLWFSLLIYGLGFGGPRSARLAYPRKTDLLLQPIEAAAVRAEEPKAATEFGFPPDRQTEWTALGHKWSELVRKNGWWRAPDLTAPGLARLLATTARISQGR